MNNREAYSCLRRGFDDLSLPESEAEAREVICHFEGCSLSGIMDRFGKDAAFDPEEIIRLRSTGMPLAYILREKNFYGNSFYVDERVLIPRFDTEIITDRAIDIVKRTRAGEVLDMCCGSGCIGISISLNAYCHVTMSDISGGALEVASINMERLGAADADLVKSDLFSDISGFFDVIVSNPPYVTEEEYASLESQVRDFEPAGALLGGLDFYDKIARQAKEHMVRGAYLLLEIGSSQEDDVRAILEKNGYADISCERDLSQLPRVMICTKN